MVPILSLQKKQLYVPSSRTLCRLSIGSLKITNSVSNINTAKSLQKSRKQLASRRNWQLSFGYWWKKSAMLSHFKGWLLSFSNEDKFLSVHVNLLPKIWPRPILNILIVQLKLLDSIKIYFYYYWSTILK